MLIILTVPKAPFFKDPVAINKNVFFFLNFFSYELFLKALQVAFMTFYIILHFSNFPWTWTLSSTKQTIQSLNQNFFNLTDK